VSVTDFYDTYDPDEAHAYDDRPTRAEAERDAAEDREDARNVARTVAGWSQ
jgi:hypothetical protein